MVRVPLTLLVGQTSYQSFQRDKAQNEIFDAPWEIEV